MNSWFFYFLKKSISERAGRFAISSAAVMLTVTVVTALITLSAGTRDKIGAELKQYGANMIVTPVSGKEIDDAEAAGIKTLSPYIKDGAFQIYGTAVVNGIDVEIIGMEPQKMTGYRTRGRIPSAGSEVMAGVNIKDVLQAKPGGGIRFSNSKSDYTITALFEKGSEEDSCIVMPLEAARTVTNRKGVSAVLLNVDTRHLKEVGDLIARNYPMLQIKTLRQVAVAEERILERIQLLMLLVTAVVLVSSVIALGSTMGANVIERMEEIGLMKSIGATQSHIRKFFMVESSLSGLAGALGGYCCGIISAEAVSKAAFGSFIPVNIAVLFVSVFLGLIMAVLSTYLPVRDAMKVVPAVILRGE